jgi:predicted membrane metal-binding protein
MKKTLLILCLLLPAFFAFAAFPIQSKQSTASQHKLTLGNGQTIFVDAFITMTDSYFELLTGQKLGFFGRIQFHQQQRSLRKLINSDGTIDENEATKTYKDLDRSKGFNLTGFMMGLTLSLVGVASMYLVKDERKKNRATWAWVGAAFWVVLLLLLIAFV